MSMTLRRNTAPDESAANGQPPEAETQMRRALGLLPSSGPRVRPRNGDGPVVEHRGDRQSGASVNRLATAEAALAEERHAREQLARQLRDAEAALHEARTKRGHAELARDEALAALAAERTAREAAEERIRQLSTAPETPAVALVAPPANAASVRTTRRRAAVETEPAEPARRRGRPPGSGSKIVRIAATAATEQNDDHGDGGDAVEWWVPGWKERI
jgi:hypothetical protein